MFMKSKILKFVVVAFMLSAFMESVLPASNAAAIAPFKIAFIGDSITELGYAGRESFRVNLWKNLVDAGVSTQFVGRNISNPPVVVPDYNGQTFIHNHLAWGGKRIETVNSYLPSNWGTASDGFDIAVILIGHNNIVAWDGKPRPAESEFNQLMKDLIATVRAKSPNVKIILQTTPRTNVNSLPLSYINEYQNIATQATTANSPIYYVPSPEGISASDTFDGTHPNELGNAKIAAGIWNVLKELVGVVPPTPSPSPTPSPTTAVTGILMNQSVETLKVPLSLQLTTVVLPAAATNKALFWTSNKTSVVIVSTMGKVTAKGPGVAIVTVKTVDGSFAKTCKFTVLMPVKSVVLSKTSLSLRKGSSYTLKMTINPSNASNKKVTWKSSNTKIVTVGSTGIVKAKAKGTAYVSVITVDGKKIAKCKITVRMHEL
ncbi:MAG: Ig-like domain-containing protein [Clostridia bacterium]